MKNFYYTKDENRWMMGIGLKKPSKEFIKMTTKETEGFFLLLTSDLTPLQYIRKVFDKQKSS